MLKMIHVSGSYLFLLTFLISCALCVLSLIRKQDPLDRLTAWSFVVSFAVLAVSYACGFQPKADVLAVVQEPVAKLANRHHDMAKFALTGMTLIGAASITVLFKFRQQRFPNWFLPNLLFLALMVATFSIRSLVYSFQMEGHPDRHKPKTSASPSPAASSTY